MYISAKSIRGFIQTTRLYKSVLVSLLLGIFTHSISYGFMSILFLMFSFSFNDFIDATKDTLGHPQRAIPSGKITRETCLYIAIILLLSAIFILSLNNSFLYGFLFIFFSSIIYSSVLKPYVAPTATVVWSMTISILFVQPFSTDILLFIAVGLIIYGYELLLDYRDIISDSLFCKRPTTAIVLGKDSIYVAILLILIGSVTLIARMFYFNESK